MSELSDQYLFSSKRLEDLSKWRQIDDRLRAKGYFARPLKLQDFNNGYLELLKQLTTIGQVDRERYEARFNEMQSINKVEEHYAIVVIVDKSTDKIIGASTLFLEYKFIHECAMRGRLEDVAVLHEYRGQSIGEIVVQIIVELAKESFKCYKLSLDCTDDLKKFYAKNEFEQSANMLAIRFE